MPFKNWAICMMFIILNSSHLAKMEKQMPIKSTNCYTLVAQILSLDFSIKLLISTQSNFLFLPISIFDALQTSDCQRAGEQSWYPSVQRVRLSDCQHVNSSANNKKKSNETMQRQNNNMTTLFSTNTIYTINNNISTTSSTVGNNRHHQHHSRHYINDNNNTPTADALNAAKQIEEREKTRLKTKPNMCEPASTCFDKTK